MKMPALLLSEYPIDATRPIESIDDLKNHLVQASMVELSTIPLYLYAAYSIQSSNYSQWAPGMSAFRAIRSVVIEEMLHLCLARNLLVAIGGDVTFYDKQFVFVYPNDMLHHTPPLQLRLERASKELMERIFMPLEKPKDPGAEPEPDYYHTLGQFYAAIEQGFEYLDSHQHDELWKDPHTALQYQHAYWNDDGGGAPIAVHDLDDRQDRDPDDRRAGRGRARDIGRGRDVRRGARAAQLHQAGRGARRALALRQVRADREGDRRDRRRLPGAREPAPRPVQRLR